MSILRDVATVALVSAGAFFFLAGTVGLIRFPDPLSRLHALTKADNLGLGFVVLGLAVRADTVSTALKLVVIWLLVLVTGALAAQMLGRAGQRETPPR